MYEIKKGDRVRCVRRDSAEGIVFEVGSLAIVKETYPATPYILELTGGLLVQTQNWEVANKSTDSESEPEITVDGAVYILKPEPEHEWEFGDWAWHPEYGVGFVTGKQDECYDVQMAFKNYRTEWVNTERLTYISTAEIPA